MARVAAIQKGLSGAKVGRWQRVKNAQAMLLYLYQATRAHRGMPADRLPRKGDRYRQVYGAPR